LYDEAHPPVTLRTQMIGDLFDSPWKIAIIAVLIIVLFGARKLPVAARELGKSMRILKKEVSSLHNDDDLDTSTPYQANQVPPAQLQAPAAPAAPDAQAQIDALSKQLADLQRSVDTSDSAQAK
jgi:sec-independent protein translocase protein TatA